MAQTNNQEPEIKFVEDLWCSEAISLGWIREIHIDKKYVNHKHLSKLIAHERKHQVYYDKWVAEKRQSKKNLIALQNNIWDFLSCWKLGFYFNLPYSIGYTFGFSIVIALLIKALIGMIP